MLREKGRLVVPKPSKKSTEAERNLRVLSRAKRKLGEEEYNRLRGSYNISWVIQKKYINMIEKKRREPVNVVADQCLLCFKQFFAKFSKIKLIVFFGKHGADRFVPCCFI